MLEVGGRPEALFQGVIGLVLFCWRDPAHCSPDAVAYLVVLQFRRFLRVDIVDEVAGPERAHASTQRRAAAFITLSMTPASQLLVSRIRALRGHRVLLVSELATLYEVPVKALVQAVKRNPERFPSDFMFHLTEQEVRALRSQIVTLNEGSTRPRGRGRHPRFTPYAFTEQGVAMLSSVLKSERAIRVNVEIMRAFVRLRGMIAHDRDLARRLDALESRYDEQFRVVFDAIRELMAPPTPPKRRIGFVTEDQAVWVTAPTRASRAAAESRGRGGPGRTRPHRR
jgi:hypothetical protein